MCSSDLEAEARISKNEENIFIFAIGANDCALEKRKNRVSEKHFERNIKMLAASARKISKRIIFVGIIPVDESKTNPLPWATEASCNNFSIEKYNYIIKNFCKENKIHFIDLFHEFMKTDYKKLLEDGDHPNAKGHQKIFEIVKEDLTNTKII